MGEETRRAQLLPLLKYEGEDAELEVERRKRKSRTKVDSFFLFGNWVGIIDGIGSDG